MKTWRNFASISLVGLCLTVPSSAANRLRAPAPDPRETRVEPDRLTPSDAVVVVTVNIRQVLETPVVKKHALGPLKMLLKRNDELQQLLTAAGLDLLKDIETITLSSPSTSTDKLFAVVRGNFDPDKARSAAEDYAKKHPSRLKSLKEGELSIWEISVDNKSCYAVFADKNALVMTTAKADAVAAVKKAGQRPEPINKDMQAALDQLKGTECVWMAMAITNDLRQTLKAEEMAKNFADAVQSVTGVLDLTKNAQLTVVVHTNDPTAATQIKGKLDELMPLLTFLGAGQDTRSRIVKEVIGNLKLDAEKRDVNIRLKLTDAQLEKARKKDQ